MAAAKVRVEFFYEILSHYSWLGFEQLIRHKSVWPSMDLHLKPCVAYFVFKALGGPMPLATNSPAKKKYIHLDLHRKAALLHVPLIVPSNIEETMAKGSLDAMSFITAIGKVSGQKDVEKITRELWMRVYNKHVDITKLDSLREAASDAKISGEITEKALSMIKSSEVKSTLKDNSNEVIKNGGFGVPTILVHNNSTPELFFGSDQMDFIAKALGEKYSGPLKP